MSATFRHAEDDEVSARERKEKEKSDALSTRWKVSEYERFCSIH
jgi:hypothetical protein